MIALAAVQLLSRPARAQQVGLANPVNRCLLGLAAALVLVAVTAACDKATLNSPTDCIFIVSPVSREFGFLQQFGTIAISTAPGCTWTASVDADWLSLVGASSGSGSGTVTYTASRFESSYGTGFRSGRINLRGDAGTAVQSVLLSQAPDCHVAFVPAFGTTAQNPFKPDGGTAHYWVLTDSPFSCPWRVTSWPTWITITSPRTNEWQHGDGDLYFAAAENTGPTSRSGVIVIGDYEFALSQTGGGAPAISR